MARDTLDLMRLIVAADDLPPRLAMKSDVTTIDYSPISIGGTAFLLPLRSKWEALDKFGIRGAELQNRHDFIGESILKFEDK